MNRFKVRIFLQAPVACALVLFSVQPLTADEGMWLFNDPPADLLRNRHNFDPSPEWLDRVQKASVRFNNGGSGSFVSPEGLILSNHHVGADALQKLSSAGRDYLKNGFIARTRDEELRCLDLELNVLVSIEDVTERVSKEVPPALGPDEAFRARRAVISQIEKESMDQTGLRSDVVTLFQGGQYHLYRYKRYTDVRLAFAPEQQIAFFGGDPDNFEYPRFALDMILFRAYDEGRPVRTPSHLVWNPQGPSENELVFVSGHPGRTSRSLTTAELEYDRDIRLPYSLERLYNLEVILTAFSARDIENARRAQDYLFGVQNSRKALRGMLAGLLDPGVFAKKRESEQRLKKAVADSAEWNEALSAWDQVAAAQRVIAGHALEYRLLEGAHAFNSDLFSAARALVRAAEEKPKPNSERLREFTESALPSFELQLFSEEPIYDDLEQLKLSDSLTWFASKLGYSDALVQKVLAGKSPAERASELVLATKLKDVNVRRKLYTGGAEAVRASADPMLELAQWVDERSRAVRGTIEAQDEIKKQAHARIANSRFALSGGNTYPDATFTLRLAFGQVKGYTEAGRQIPFQTRLEGLYARAESQSSRPPFDIPKIWIDKKEKIDLKAPFNFVSTCDIIGGNSGSPVINRKGELVGLIFDGNLYSLVLDYLYTDEQARAVSVHTAAMTEALRAVYDAQFLLDELLAP